MNNIILKQAIRMIGPEKIIETAGQFLTEVIAHKNAVTLDITKGETQVAALFYEVNGIIYFVPAVFNDQNSIVRYLQEPMAINDMLKKHLEKF